MKIFKRLLLASVLTILITVFNFTSAIIPENNNEKINELVCEQVPGEPAQYSLKSDFCEPKLAPFGPDQVQIINGSTEGKYIVVPYNGTPSGELDINVALTAALGDPAVKTLILGEGPLEVPANKLFLKNTFDLDISLYRDNFTLTGNLKFRNINTGDLNGKDGLFNINEFSLKTENLTIEVDNAVTVSNLLYVQGQCAVNISDNTVITHPNGTAINVAGSKTILNVSKTSENTKPYINGVKGIFNNGTVNVYSGEIVSTGADADTAIAIENDELLYVNDTISGNTVITSASGSAIFNKDRAYISGGVISGLKTLINGDNDPAVIAEMNIANEADRKVTVTSGGNAVTNYETLIVDGADIIGGTAIRNISGKTTINASFGKTTDIDSTGSRAILFDGTLEINGGTVKKGIANIGNGASTLDIKGGTVTKGTNDYAVSLIYAEDTVNRSLTLNDCLVEGLKTEKLNNLNIGVNAKFNGNIDFYYKNSYAIKLYNHLFVSAEICNCNLKYSGTQIDSLNYDDTDFTATCVDTSKGLFCYKIDDSQVLYDKTVKLSQMSGLSVEILFKNILEINVNPADLTLTYKFLPQTIVYSTNPSAVECKIEWYSDINGVTKIPAVNIAPVGVYYFRVIYDGADYCHIKTDIFTLNIIKKAVTVSYELPQNLIFDGTVKNVNVIIEGIIQGSGVTTDIVNHFKTDAGTYEIAVKLKGDNAVNYQISNNTYTYTIEKADSVITCEDIEEIYNGQVYKVTAELNHTDCPITEENNNNRNAGTYTVTFKAAGSTNYKPAQKTATVKILRKPIKVIAVGTKAVLGKAYSLTFTTDGVVASDKLNGSLAIAGEIINIGTYPILQGTINNESNPNYDITYTDANLEVTPSLIKSDVCSIEVLDTETYLKNDALLAVLEFDKKSELGNKAKTIDGNLKNYIIYDIEIESSEDLKGLYCFKLLMNEKLLKKQNLRLFSMTDNSLTELDFITDNGYIVFKDTTDGVYVITYEYNNALTYIIIFSCCFVFLAIILIAMIIRNKVPSLKVREQVVFNNDEFLNASKEKEEGKEKDSASATAANADAKPDEKPDFSKAVDVQKYNESAAPKNNDENTAVGGIKIDYERIKRMKEEKLKKEQEAKEKEKAKKLANIHRNTETKENKENKEEITAVDRNNDGIKDKYQEESMVINITEEKVKEILTPEEVKEEKSAEEINAPAEDPFKKPVSSSFIKIEEDDFEKFLEQERLKNQH